MKYILMMQFPQSFWQTSHMDTWPPKDRESHMDHLTRMNRDLVASGERVDVQGLGKPETAVFVRADSNGKPAVTDGPFAEAKEFLVGYLIVDVASPERAHEIAARWSAGPGPGGKPLNFPVEVRPLL
jgi:hypothetical protein